MSKTRSTCLFLLTLGVVACAADGTIDHADSQRAACTALADEAAAAAAVDLPDVSEDLVAQRCELEPVLDATLDRFVDGIERDGQRWSEEASATLEAIEILGEARHEVSFRLAAEDLCNTSPCVAWCNTAGTSCIEIKNGGGNCLTFQLEGATVTSCAPWYPEPA